MVVYPAIFKSCAEGGYAIRFPDLPGTNSQGDDLFEAINMARDALALMLDCLDEDGTPFPKPSEHATLFIGDDEFITLGDADPEIYRRQRDNAAVRRTISLPKWMDDRVSESHISLSSVTQEALRERFGIAK